MGGLIDLDLDLDLELDGRAGADASGTEPSEGARIDGVELLPLDPRPDPRGAFTEIFATSWGRRLAPEQWSLVRSEAGVLRGMHLHRRHDEYFMLVTGKAWVGLHDVRPGSPTEGRACLFALDGAEPGALFLPRGVVHGWCFGEPSIHIQATSEPYAIYAGDDNRGCHWSDPELGIRWPFAPSKVAPRADAFPSLRELVAETLRIDPDFAY